MSSINDTLAKMRKSGKMQDMKGKGNYGEDAVLQLCVERKAKVGNGILMHSYKYPYQTNREGITYTGNVKYENGKFVAYDGGNGHTLEDEIDILYITPYRAFAIEVKSYHAKSIEVYKHWMNKNGAPVDKSPIAQAEKHARHLYHAIYDVLPDGRPEYIVPLVCFVDRCTLRDDREQRFADYVPVCVLNTFLRTFNKYNTPLQYNLDLVAIDKKLKEVKVSVEHIL